MRPLEQFGVRFNLDFFIIRADIAIPLKNPSIPVNDPDFPLKSRWIFEIMKTKILSPGSIQLGNSYPF